MDIINDITNRLAEASKYAIRRIVKVETRKLDCYKNKYNTTNNYSGVIKNIVSHHICVNCNQLLFVLLVNISSMSFMIVLAFYL